jgi:hypothetical protein
VRIIRISAAFLAAAACANATLPVREATPEVLGIPAAAFVTPELARKAAVLETCIENPEPSFAVTTVLYPDLVEVWDARYAPLFFYEVTVVAGQNVAFDFDRLAGFVEVEEGPSNAEAAGAAGTWALTTDGKKALDGLLSRAGGPVVAIVLVPANTAYPMLVVPSAGFALWRPALAAAAAEIIPTAEFGPPGAVVGGPGQYLLFESKSGNVAFETFNYGRATTERRPYFTDVGALEGSIKTAAAAAPEGEDDTRWSEAVRSLWPWLEKIIPDGKTVTVDAADVKRKYNEFMQTQMGARD